MEDYREIVDDVILELEKYDSKREEVIKLVRQLNRASGRGISKIVREEPYDVYLQNSRELILQIEPIMDEISPITSWNLTSSGTEEYAEFELLHAIISGQSLPSPNALHVPSWIWITALGDVIGELRRFMLSQIINHDLDKAESILHTIQELYDTIVGLEFSKSLVSNLRRKVDVARSLVDRCESDFATAVIHKQSKTSAS